MCRFCLSHPFVKLKVVKRWCCQILEGLVYLHSLRPPVIHRDIKCENMLYNSADGTITIGDLGLATRATVEGPVDGGVSGVCVCVCAKGAANNARAPAAPPLLQMLWVLCTCMGMCGHVCTPCVWICVCSDVCGHVQAHHRLSFACAPVRAVRRVPVSLRFRHPELHGLRNVRRRVR